MKDRFISGYNDFVLPFVIGMSFILIYLAIGIIRVIAQLPAQDRKKFFLSLINPKLWIINLKDIICDVLLHTRIWKRKPLLRHGCLYRTDCPLSTIRYSSVFSSWKQTIPSEAHSSSS